MCKSRPQSPEPNHVIRPPTDIDTLPSLVSKTCHRQPDRPAVQWREGDQLLQLSYRQLWNYVESLARALLASGFSPNDHLAIWSENRWEWVASYLAIQRIGAVVIPLDALQKPHEIRHIIVNAEVKLVCASKKFLDHLIRIVERIPRGIRIMSFDPTADCPSLEEWLEKGAAGEIPQNAAPTLDSLAAIIYTSGTTGFSKGVMLTHRNIASNIAGFYQVLYFGPEDVFLSVLPAYHTFECTAGMLAPLVAGSTIQFAKSLKSRDLVNDFRVGNITMMLGVPLLFEKLLAAIKNEIDKQPWHTKALLKTMMQGVKAVKRVTGVNLGRVAFRQLRNKSGLGSIRLMISGGAALPPGIAEAYNELGLCLMQGYGLTETSPVLTTNTPGHAKHSTVGKAVPGVTLKIDNPNSTGSGEIMAKGDCVMVGYNKNEEATQEAFREGWFATGDYGWLDSEGYLTITGRVKDLIVTGAGKNINPEEVEAELNRSQFIQESLVLGVASKSGVGEDLAALVVPDFEVIDRHAESTGITMTPDKLEQMMRAEVRNQCSQLPDYKRIRKVKLHMEELQRTSTGKLKRFLYREHVLPIPPLE